MRILTISASPYLNSKLGKINAYILTHLKQKGHQVSSAVWHLDPSYYMPDESDGLNYFEIDDKKICRLYPIEDNPIVSVKSTYEIMKDFSPQIVITIGDYFQTDFVHAIKATYPNLFKWIAVLTLNCLPIEKSHKDALDYIDQSIITTIDGKVNFNKIVNVPSVYCNPGIDLCLFTDYKRENSNFTIVTNLKNSQQSNITAFIKAVSLLRKQDYKIEAFLHSNFNDKGDYNLPLIIEEEGLTEIKTTSTFSSVQCGPPDIFLRDIYRSSHLFVDSSMQSSSAMNLLEAMACGCIPLAVRVGAMKDIILQMPEPWQHTIESVPFLGERHQEMRVADPLSIAELIRLHYLEFKANKLLEKSINSARIAQRYSRDKFVLEIESAIGRSVSETQSILTVDELSINKKKELISR